MGRGIAPMLRRIIGEHIELRISADEALVRVRADRGQLEQVLLNLAVNARDAMPGGGAISITADEASADQRRADRLAPGRYVVLSVIDKGSGMDAETLARRAASRGDRPRPTAKRWPTPTSPRGISCPAATQSC